MAGRAAVHRAGTIACRPGKNGAIISAEGGVGSGGGADCRRVGLGPGERESDAHSKERRRSARSRWIASHDPAQGWGALANASRTWLLEPTAREAQKIGMRRVFHT